MSLCPNPSRCELGATRLEMIVVTLIVIVLAVWLLHTLRFYQELTEKTVVENTIVNLRSGLRFRIADLILKGTPERQADLTESNPMVFAEAPPKGYLGEMRAPRDLPPGSWFYEQDRAELVYIPVLKNNLSLVDGTQPEKLRLRWQIKKAGKEAGAMAIDIVLLTPYTWF